MRIKCLVQAHNITQQWDSNPQPISQVESLAHYLLSFSAPLKSKEIVFEIRSLSMYLIAGSEISDKNRSTDVAGNVDG